jgi:hypothetical protein
MAFDGAGSLAHIVPGDYEKCRMSGSNDNTLMPEFFSLI